MRQLHPNPQHPIGCARAGSSLLDVDTVLTLRIKIQGETGMSFRCEMERSSISKHNLPFALTTILLLLPSLAIRAQSQELTLQFTSSSTSINFTLGDILHTVHGSFNLKSGQVRYDPATTAVHGSLLADANSGQSGNHIRDRRMHREILESARYPEITFRPDRVAGKVASTGTSTVQVHGIFSIHGADHELTLPVRVQMFADHWIADTHFTVPYVKWGVKNPSTFLLRVSESVEIDVHATGASPFASVGGH
jgi:polyisoprenoid-binding protein YceI